MVVEGGDVREGGREGGKEGGEGWSERGREGGCQISSVTDIHS